MGYLNKWDIAGSNPAYPTKKKIKTQGEIDMFAQRIDNTPLSSDMANISLKRIYRTSPSVYDNSLLVTARALLDPRIPEGETLFIHEMVYNPPESKSPADAIKGHFEGYSTPYLIHCIVSRMGDETLEVLRDKFCKMYEGFERLDAVTVFFKRAFNILCFVNKEKKQAVLFTERLDIRKYHYMQCAILSFMPWYFNPEDGVSDDEMALINSLRSNSVGDYIDAIEKISQRYDFRTMFIKTKLDGFEKVFERRELEAARQSYERVVNKINSYSAEISNLLQDKSEYEARIFGLKYKIEEESDSEIMEYFIRNKRLVLQYVQDNNITFAVKDYISYFDEDIIMKLLNNKNSFMYMPNIPKEDLELFFKEAFIEESIKIRTCASYALRVPGGVQAISNGDFSDSQFINCIPNAHINRYSCLGNYLITINEAITNGDYITAIEQCVASCKSLNFSDAVVAEDFVGTLFRGNAPRCVELPDGRCVTAKKAIEWLKEGNEEHEQDN